MTKTRKLLRGALVAVFLSTSALSAATVNEITLGDFVDPVILDFEAVSAGDIDNDDPLFSAIGISSVSATAGDYKDDFQNRNNSSARALWFTAGNQLTIVDPSVSAGRIYGRLNASYTIDFFGPLMRFGFSTHDEQTNDPWATGPQEFLIVEFYSGESFVGSMTSNGVLVAGASDQWDRRDFFFANDESFNRVVLSVVGNAGFGLDNFVVQRRDIGGISEIPEPGSIGLLGLGLIGLAAARRRQALRNEKDPS